MRVKNFVWENSSQVRRAPSPSPAQEYSRETATKKAKKARNKKAEGFFDGPSSRSKKYQRTFEGLRF